MLCCSCICNGLVTLNFYLGYIEQVFLLWRLYALYGGGVYYWVYSGGNVIFSFAVDNCLILLIALFVI